MLLLEGHKSRIILPILGSMASVMLLENCQLGDLLQQVLRSVKTKANIENTDLSR